MPNTNIYFSEHFKKQLKKLKKKYPQVKTDLVNTFKTLNLENEISIGRSIYKIRIPSSDMNKGKSGGFRSYIHVYIKNNLLVPLCIYAKSKLENISENELKYHFDQTNTEIIENM